MSSPCLIKDLPKTERPRERLQSLGAKALSDAELVALLFGTGRAGLSVIDLSRELLTHFGSLKALSRTDPADLEAFAGIGPAKSAQLLAVFEFARRMAGEAFESRSIETPADVYDLLQVEMGALNQESVRVVLLDHRKQLIRVVEVFRGTKDQSFAAPPELLKPAISHSAASIILVHNHPTGDPSPSAADIRATRNMSSACETMGIGLADHVIIGSVSATFPSGYYSFREGGLL